MSFLNSCETAKKLVHLIKSHSYVSFAVAWATTGKDNPVFDALREAREKIRKSVVGTSSYLTDPRVLEWSMQETSQIKCVKVKKGTPMFHPKIYVLWSQDGWDLLIGSANLTRGGMKRNTELMLHMSGSDCSAELFLNTRKEINRYWNQSDEIKRAWLNQYRKKHKLHTEKKRKIDTPSSIDVEIPELLQLSWSEFYSIVQLKGEKSEIDSRLNFLRFAKRKFDDNDPFSKLSNADRRSLAATVYHGEGESAQLGLKIGWFGFQTGNGDYRKAINENNKNLSHALSFIPVSRSKYVQKSDYLSCVNEYEKAFDGKKFGLSLLTRLLALKRPDVFVPWNDGNQRKLRHDLLLKPTLNTRHFERYWDDLIERIKDAPWHCSHRPNGRMQGEIWDARVAMLDVLFYDPD